LRSYLSMGARVSDHAVIDRNMNTMHVYTALKIAEIPVGRARMLRTLSA
jgi:L-ornithine Nalpha-acyltransferase